MSYEYYSSLALVSSVVVYALAMFAHTAEWAAARRPGVAKPATRELVDVAAAERSDGQMRPGPFDERARALAEASLAADSVADLTAGRRVEQFGRIGVALTMIGFVLSIFGVLTRGLAAQRAPWGNMFEFTITAMVFVVGVYLILVWRAGLRGHRPLPGGDGRRFRHATSRLIALRSRSRRQSPARRHGG